MNAIRLLIASEVRFYRDGLALYLGRQPHFTILGTAADYPDTIHRVLELAPDIVLLDIAMADSLIAVRELAERAPQVRVVVLAVPELECDVISCAEAGVAGYVSRGGSLEDLVAIVESAARGELIISPKMAASLLKRVSILAADRIPGAKRIELTAREGEIVQLIDQGLSNKQIAARLGVEPTTVKNHVHNILEKLQVHRRSQVAGRLRASRRAQVLRMGGTHHVELLYYLVGGLSGSLALALG